MNIKSLLLGSAAVLAAVSGARAADAVVVAEPEPMEYVRICDVYGAGYYYIPGTETCLSLRGYVRYEIGFDDRDDGWKKRAQAHLDFDARSETEYGTLTSHITLRARSDSGANGTIYRPIRTAYDNSGTFVTLQGAWISLAGLQMGWTDTLYDGGIPGEFDEGGGDLVHFVRYNWVGGNGISVSVGLEEENFNTDYVPNVVAHVGIAQGWGGVDLYAAYDDDDNDRGRVRDDEFALKATATFNATEQLTLAAIATYESGNSFYSADPTKNLIRNIVGAGYYGGFEWSLGASATFKANEKTSITVGGQYFGDNHFVDALNVPGVSLDAWVVGANVNYEITKDFTALLAVNYTKFDLNGATLAPGTDDDAISGFLRFQRSF